MKNQTYSKVAGTVFLVIALMHLLRIINGWEASISGWAAPLWLSWLGLVAGSVLAYFGFRSAKA
jgi:hypothetical protein